ncbi:hypothetical protein GVY41_15890 [Frigidibacter albus]|uniref:DUF4177 domain-containing protein n=1 Tax=Frigidibacter albus TaxID=1465486 RepID=A0A6L8VJ45_9RHOB|nr:hypothetical protein [Frigidibacter albus]MZQ90397.1 hypothetical protein [Frigidibacter albus]NBE32483.1 hypothetical protein [Frigidibacter albus]GGH59983.1 hypothetical protein GCM10011341_31800 [Frigidibacter albus]
MITRIALTLTLLLATASPAAAECFADYKAKQEGGSLKLHYGIAELPDRACGSKRDAADALGPRLAAGGWTLLNVVSIFGPDGLAQRKDSAGQFFLRY